MKKRKDPRKITEILTRASQTFDSQMPVILYKKSYTAKTKTWDILWLKPNFERNTGLSYKNFKHDRVFWMERLHPDDKESTYSNLEALRKGKADSLEITYRWLHKDGTYHWFIDHATLLRDTEKKPLEIIGAWVDISAHTQAEKIIEENEEHYKKIVELSPHALFVHNEGAFRFLNASAVKLFGGKEAEDIIGKPISNFIHPDYHERFMEQINIVFEEKIPAPLIDYKIITLQGDVRYVEIASTPFTFQGKLSVQGVIVDVTKLKLAEELYLANADELEHLNKLLMRREVERSTRGNTIHNSSFDQGRGVLLLDETEVKIQKFSKQYYLLQIIFKNIENTKKDWQFSEISELLDIEAQFDWKRLYNIADAIRKNVAIETGIKDFFILTTQSLKINPLYLAKS